MKAIIMAGGEGSRLRPLTCDCPKPMMRLMNRPIMQYAVELLAAHGVTEIAATLGYQPDAILDYFGDGSALGVSLRWFVEPAPLGTAGGVRQAREMLDETFAVLSGDGLTDLNLTEAAAFHRQRGALATLVLRREPNPSEYGVVCMDEDGRIRRFYEKPGRCDLVSDLINTGVYILEPEVLDRIPADRPYDFGHDLFPRLAEEGAPLFGYVMNGYWCDVGTPLSYYQCCVDALRGRLDLSPAPEFAAAPAPDDGDDGSGGVICPCRDRAELMGTLSELFMDMGADYSDGLRVSGDGFELHIAPLASRSAVRVAIESEREEFARELTSTALELIRALDK